MASPDPHPSAEDEPTTQPSEDTPRSSNTGTELLPATSTARRLTTPEPASPASPRVSETPRPMTPPLPPSPEAEIALLEAGCPSDILAADAISSPPTIFNSPPPVSHRRVSHPQVSSPAVPTSSPPLPQSSSALPPSSLPLPQSPTPLPQSPPASSDAAVGDEGEDAKEDYEAAPIFAPSPTSPVERSKDVQTEGVYFRFLADCPKECYESPGAQRKAARNAYVNEQKTMLSREGKVPGRVRWRNDGLGIDWTLSPHLDTRPPHDDSDFEIVDGPAEQVTADEASSLLSPPNPVAAQPPSSPPPPQSPASPAQTTSPSPPPQSPPTGEDATTQPPEADPNTAADQITPLPESPVDSECPVGSDSPVGSESPVSSVQQPKPRATGKRNSPTPRANTTVSARPATGLAVRPDAAGTGSTAPPEQAEAAPEISEEDQLDDFKTSLGPIPFLCNLVGKTGLMPKPEGQYRFWVPSSVAPHHILKEDNRAAYNQWRSGLRDCIANLTDTNGVKIYDVKVRGDTRPPFSVIISWSQFPGQKDREDKRQLQLLASTTKVPLNIKCYNSDDPIPTTSDDYGELHESACGYRWISLPPRPFKWSDVLARYTLPDKRGIERYATFKAVRKDRAFVFWKEREAYAELLKKQLDVEAAEVARIQKPRLDRETRTIGRLFERREELIEAAEEQAAKSNARIVLPKPSAPSASSNVLSTAAGTTSTASTESASRASVPTPAVTAASANPADGEGGCPSSHPDDLRESDVSQAPSTHDSPSPEPGESHAVSVTAADPSPEHIEQREGTVPRELEDGEVDEVLVTPKEGELVSDQETGHASQDLQLDEQPPCAEDASNLAPRDRDGREHGVAQPQDSAAPVVMSPVSSRPEGLVAGRQDSQPTTKTTKRPPPSPVTAKYSASKVNQHDTVASNNRQPPLRRPSSSNNVSTRATSNAPIDKQFFQHRPSGYVFFSFPPEFASEESRRSAAFAKWGHSLRAMYDGAQFGVPTSVVYRDTGRDMKVSWRPLSSTPDQQGSGSQEQGKQKGRCMQSTGPSFNHKTRRYSAPSGSIVIPYPPHMRSKASHATEHFAEWKLQKIWEHDPHNSLGHSIYNVQAALAAQGLKITWSMPRRDEDDERVQAPGDRLPSRKNDDKGPQSAPARERSASSASPSASYVQRVGPNAEMDRRRSLDRRTSDVPQRRNSPTAVPSRAEKQLATSGASSGATHVSQRTVEAEPRRVTEVNNVKRKGESLEPQAKRQRDDHGQARNASLPRKEGQQELADKSSGIPGPSAKSVGSAASSQGPEADFQLTTRKRQRDEERVAKSDAPSAPTPSLSRSSPRPLLNGVGASTALPGEQGSKRQRTVEEDTAPKAIAGGGGQQPRSTLDTRAKDGSPGDQPSTPSSSKSVPVQPARPSVASLPPINTTAANSSTSAANTPVLSAREKMMQMKAKMSNILGRLEKCEDLLQMKDS